MENTVPIQLYESGMSVIPVNNTKLPLGKWEHLQTERHKPNGEFERAEAVAIVCGESSGNVQCIDYDTKYDITGTLMKDFKKRLNNPKLLHKVVIQKTPSGGYHLIFRCDEISGNEKLAQRPATSLEKLDNKNDKSRVLIETRGRGGYFLVSPSEGYSIEYGDIFDVPKITAEEREQLFACARSFNQVFTQHYTPNQNITIDGDRPGDNYNKNGDILPLLEQYGWSTAGTDRSGNVLLRRPGKDSSHSASYSQSLKTFYVFSSSTEFDPGKAYSNFQVYSKLVFGDDYQQAAKKLLDDGYGNKHKRISNPQIATIRSVSPDELSAILNSDGVDKYIDAVREDKLKLGLSTGLPHLDRHFLFKRGNLVIVNGHENVGKSVFMWYLMLMASLRHDWRWIVCTMENSRGYFFRRMIEFINNKPIKDISDADYRIAKSFVEEHFFVFDNARTYTAFDLLSYAKGAIDKHGKLDGMLIDPYNSLDYPMEASKHDYDYKVLNSIAAFKKQHDMCIYINTHAYTFAARKKEGGYIAAPERADTEGGVKFAAKADDFLTLHRLTNHETDWKITEVHVRKIKEIETGGMTTFKDRPVKFQMIDGNCGFSDESGFNAITGETYESLRIIPTVNI